MHEGFCNTYSELSINAQFDFDDKTINHHPIFSMACGINMNILNRYLIRELKGENAFLKERIKQLESGNIGQISNQPTRAKGADVKVQVEASKALEKLKLSLLDKTNDKDFRLCGFHFCFKPLLWKLSSTFQKSTRPNK